MGRHTWCYQQHISMFSKTCKHETVTRVTELKYISKLLEVRQFILLF